MHHRRDAKVARTDRGDDLAALVVPAHILQDLAHCSPRNPSRHVQSPSRSTAVIHPGVPRSDLKLSVDRVRNGAARICRPARVDVACARPVRYFVDTRSPGLVAAMVTRCTRATIGAAAVRAPVVSRSRTTSRSRLVATRWAEPLIQSRTSRPSAAVSARSSPRVARTARPAAELQRRLDRRGGPRWSAQIGSTGRPTLRDPRGLTLQCRKGVDVPRCSPVSDSSPRCMMLQDDRCRQRRLRHLPLGPRNDDSAACANRPDANIVNMGHASVDLADRRQAQAVTAGTATRRWADAAMKKWLPNRTGHVLSASRALVSLVAWSVRHDRLAGLAMASDRLVIGI